MKFLHKSWAEGLVKPPITKILNGQDIQVCRTVRFLLHFSWKQVSCKMPMGPFQFITSVTSSIFCSFIVHYIWRQWPSILQLWLMKKQEQDLAFSVGWNCSSRHLDIILSLNSRVPPKLVLLARAPPSFPQSKHRRLTEGGHHNTLVAQVNPAHCLKQGYWSSQITAWAETVHSTAGQHHLQQKGRHKWPLEWISTYFH